MTKCERIDPVAWEIRFGSLYPASIELTPFAGRAEEARQLGFEVHELVRREAALTAAPQASAEESAIDKPIPDSVEHYGLIDERVGAPAAEDSEKGAGDVALPPLPEHQFLHKELGKLWDSTAMYLYALRHNVLDRLRRQQRGGEVALPERYTYAEWEKYQRNRAALAAQPAASAEPLNRQAIADRFAFLEGVVNEHNYRLIVDTACALAAQPAADDAMERALTELVDKIVPGLDTGDLVADARTASKALDHAQPAASAEPAEVTDAMALAFHHAITDGAIGQEDVDEIKTGLRAALLNVALAAHKPDGGDERDAAFEAVRQRLCKLQRYSFLIGPNGGVRRVKDSVGNWIEFDAAHALFDPVEVDAAISAQQRQEGK